MVNIIIGWDMSDIGDEGVSFKNGLKQVFTSASGKREGYETDEDHIYFVSSKDRVDALAGQGLCDVLVCTEVLGGQNIGVGALKQWRRVGNVEKVILIVADSKYGKGKVKGIYDSGFYDILFEKDFTGRNLIDLVLKSRSEKQAYQYYGLENYRDLLTDSAEPAPEVKDAEEEEETGQDDTDEIIKDEVPEDPFAKPLESESAVIDRQHDVEDAMYAEGGEPDFNRSIVDFLKADTDVSKYLEAMEEAALTLPVIEHEFSVKDKVLEELLDHYTTEDHSWMSNLEKHLTTKEQWDAELSLRIQNYDLDPETQRQVFYEFNRFMFGYDFIEEFIDDPLITDIKILSPDALQIKRKGKRKPQDLVFRSPEHYRAFVSHLAKRNHVNIQQNAVVKFVDVKSFDYCRLRVNITTEYVNCNGYPCVQMRKENNTKYTTSDLVAAGMFTEETAAYLIYKARNDSGIVFTGGNAQGKTSVMNWLIDYIPRDMSGLCIQESDELFSNYHRYLDFKEVTTDEEGNMEGDKGVYDLKKLSVNGLLTDNDYFIIGEIKGEEAKYFINSVYTGSRCWASVHGSSTEAALPKIADYAMYDTKYSREDLLQMLTSLKVIIFIKDFQIIEISEVQGWDAENQRIVYKKIPITVPKKPKKHKRDA